MAIHLRVSLWDEPVDGFFSWLSWALYMFPHGVHHGLEELSLRHGSCRNLPEPFLHSLAVRNQQDITRPIRELGLL